MIGTLDKSLSDGLHPVAASVAAYASPGLGDVSAMVARIERAQRFLVDRLGVDPRLAVLVLSQDDWAARSAHPLYGMPNFRDGNLVLAGEPNPFWEGMVSLAVAEVPGAGAELARVYPAGAAGPDLRPFFDLLGVHELAHVFIEAARRTPRQLWALELSCNVLLQAFVTHEEPASLAVLETFPRLFAAVPAQRFAHRSLGDFERSYAHGMDGANYGWFQSHLQMMAKSVCDGGGHGAVGALWALLADDVADLAPALAKRFGPVVAGHLAELGAGG